MAAASRPVSGASVAAPSAVAALPPAVRERLARLGIRRLDDALLHFPSHYEDETRVTMIREAPSGQVVQVEGVVLSAEVTFRPRRQLVCQVEDASGVLFLRFFHFYPSQQKQLSPGRRVRLLGEVRGGFFGDEMVHPQVKVVQADTPLAERLTPIYPTVQGLSQSVLRKLIQRALQAWSGADGVPPEVLEDLGLMPWGACVRLLHQPPPDTDRAALEGRWHPAWQRVRFDELLAQQLSMRMAHSARRAQGAPRVHASGERVAALLASLPFALTPAQQRVWEEIRHDLGEPHPMQRLLQGDVGSGKTVVAAMAALQALEAGYQVAVMAPTDLLAEQHVRKFREWLEPLGMEVGWLAGSQKKKERQAVEARLADGSLGLAVGTHALFQQSVGFARLALVIVDEQHRFGVEQRLALRDKGVQPHQLMMSATPIPRTLAMSYYADLDVSTIDQLPPGRKPIATRVLSEARRVEVTEGVRRVCAEGRQVYWVCPLIEESETLQLQTAVATFEALQHSLSDLRVGLVHGRLPSAEKAAVMAAFLAGQVQVLVATTVIEVGVDVPNATLMVVEHAERFGLAQLHQLRGRVGRGSGESVCLLMYSNPLGDVAKQRLRVMRETTDGFEIARHDLQIRGPGEFLGVRQSGAPLLRYADLERDGAWLEQARVLAEQMLRQYPQQVATHLALWMGGREDLLKT